MTIDGPPAVVTVTRPGQGFQYSFAGSQGQFVSLGVSTTLTSHKATFFDELNGALYGPDGSLFQTFTPVVTQTTLTLFRLPTTGTYALPVAPMTDAIGQYELALRSMVITTAVVNGPPIMANMPLTGQAGLVQFALTQAQPVKIVFEPQAGLPNWNANVYAPDGSLLEGISTSGSGPYVMDLNSLRGRATPGTYSIYLAANVYRPIALTVTVATSILQNGGFESGDLSGWTLTQGSYGVLIASGHDGTYGLQLQGASQVRQQVNTVPGQTYSVTGWLRIAERGTLNTATAAIEARDANSSTLGSASSNVGANDTGIWTPIGFSFVASSATTTIALRTAVDPSSANLVIWADDLFVGGQSGLVPTPTPVPPTPTAVVPTQTPLPGSAMPTSPPTNTPTATPTLGPTPTGTPVPLDGTLTQSGASYVLTTRVASQLVRLGFTATSNTQTIGTVKFVNGTFNTTSGVARGTFAANLAMQYTLNGTTWQTATGWTLAPSYSYTNTAGGVQFAFTGAPIASVKGVRVVGQLTTTGSSSKRARVREVMAYSQQNDALPITVIADEHGGAKVLTRLEQRSAHVTLLVSEISLSNGAFRSSHRRMYRKHRHATK